MDNSTASRQDQPLPHSMSTRLAGAASIARQYPIFGRTWFRYRMRSFLLPLLLLALMLGLIGFFARQVPGMLLTLTAIWCIVALALSLGRALAVLVRTRGWPAQREAVGVVCALAFGMLVLLPLTPYTRIAEAPGKRPLTPRQLQLEREGEVVNLVIWSLALAWLGGTTDLVAYFRQRRLLRESELLGQVERYKDERNEVAMQLAVLASQVEPHFLFNTLSGVRAAMLSDPARGIAMIDHLVDYLRATIPQLRADGAQPYVALGAQLDAAQAYLGIIEARMPRLRSRIACPLELRDAAIPPLMLISLVENAVKHGIELKKGPGRIEISATRRQGERGDLLEVAVADDGIGFGTATSGSGIGLANIRERLKHLYGGEAALSLRAGDAGGVVASLVLPLRTLSTRKN
ncbi:histidine kinase [Massilia sp. Dwa41.01b]|uniref:sensor histidine kinase n=1 Tax=unclassified Massilia TaxID=2609279 RepID=UPI001602BC30|nr:MULTISPECIES: histidine kinase [unclassified Massilia]QNA87778.1 histidine kinase [Massilia sp. Dwa41.01b]QNA98682.1 histidine kinase [Massilia sp. Se16.2.3]